MLSEQRHLKPLLALAAFASCNGFSSTAGSEDLECALAFDSWRGSWRIGFVSDDEKEVMFNTFCERRKKVMAHNADPRHGWTKKLTGPYAHLKDRARYFATGHVHPDNETALLQRVDKFIRHDHADEDEERRRQLAPIPASVDWQPVLPPVIDQGACGNCWAVTSAETGYGSFLTQKATNVDDPEPWILNRQLSFQQLTDCDSSNYGCNGGNYLQAFKWIEANHGTNGLWCTSDQYPQHSPPGQGTCASMTCSRPTWVYGSHCVEFTQGDDAFISAMKTAVAQQPVAVVIKSCCLDFDYSGGILQDTHCAATVDHAVVIVGYGRDHSGTDYWKVKNSWGSWWGEQGHFRVRQKQGNSADVCGIKSWYPCYPTPVGYPNEPH